MQTKADRIFYWNGIFDPKGLTFEYESLIKKLVDGDYTGLNLEKLAGHNVYSVRINDCDRLLFTTIHVNGIPYLMVLDVVLNHDYDKSRFLKPGVLKNYLELHGHMLTEQLIAEQFHAHVATTPFLEKDKQTTHSLEFARIDYYNQQFIELNDAQLNAATKTALPLIISGVPGSGKSCIALLILAQYIESHVEPEGPIMYCCKSEELASHMQHLWNSLPIAQRCRHTVLFKHYTQLITESLTENKTLVEKDHCIEWIKEYITEQRTIDKTKNKAHFSPDCETVYQEFRIISGSLDSYHEPGKKKFFFQEKEEKLWIEKAFTKYQKHLENQQAIHAPFYPLTSQNPYKLIVVDEAQDLSHLQLKLLAQLTENKQIAYCIDDRQSLSDNKSKQPFLEELTYDWLGKKQNPIALDKTYRSPLNMTLIANMVSNLESIATGKGQPEIIPSNDSSKKGCVKWFNSLSKAELLALQNEANSPDFAVITLSEHKEEAKKLFKTELVFTVEEIKGLEYKKVMAYRLLDNPLFEEANKIIAGKDIEASKKTSNRAKNNQGNEQLGIPFNSLYTAFTRPTETLYIYQPYCHKRQHLIKHLKDAIPKEGNALNATQAISKTENETQWFNQVKRLLQEGHDEAAQSIYVDKLGKTQEEFEQIKRLFSSKKATPLPQPEKKEPAIELKTNNSPKPQVKQATPITQKSTKSAQTPPSKPNNTNSTKTTTVNNDLYQAMLAIDKLMNNKSDKLTPNSLTAFFKNKKAATYLFDTGLAEGENLFTLLLKERYNETFVNYLQAHYNQKFFKKHLTGERLCKINLSDNMSPLYLLASTEEGIEVLHDLFEKNPTLVKTISLEALCTPLPLKTGRYANTSTLYLLSQTHKGIKILTTLFKNNPSLVQNIDGKVFCLALTSQSKTYVNQSALYTLVQEPAGIALLKTIIENNENFAQTIPGEALCLSLPKQAGADANKSSLLYLTEHNDNIEFFKVLLTKNPNLATSITASALCLALPAGENANHSPIFFLAQSEKNFGVLEILFKNNKNLAKNIPTEALCLPITSRLGKVSTLYYLTLQNRIDIFKILLAENPNLANELTAEQLCLTNNVGTSPLFSLATHQEGTEILNTLLLKNDARLAKTMTAEALCRALSHEAGIYVNLSPLFLLATPEHLKTLQILFEHNPKLAKTITGEALCRTAKKDGILASPLFFLARSTEGIKILKQLIKNNPTLPALLLKDKALTYSSGQYLSLSNQLTEQYIEGFRQELAQIVYTNTNVFFQKASEKEESLKYTVGPHTK